MKHQKTLETILEVARSGSIRGSAEKLHLTPSALTRKIQDFEYELGCTIFERLPQGMRPNAAGELLLRHIRDQFSDFERLRSQISDLSGIRRGHVSIVCSQAFAFKVVPEQIASYRKLYPQVSFEVLVRDHDSGLKALLDFEADLALLLHPTAAPDAQAIFSFDQPLCAMMHSGHPLTREGSVRLRECFQYPVAMPDHSLAIRHVLDAATAKQMITPDIRIESSSPEFLRHYSLLENVVSFQIPLGIPVGSSNVCARPIDTRDIPPLQTLLYQMRGRTLSVAAAKFADHLIAALLKE